MLKAHRWGVVLVLAVTLSGCAFKSTRLRKQAARDMGCHTFGVKVHRMPQSDNRYVARGCHQEAEYELDGDDMPVMVAGPRPYAGAAR